VQPPAEDEDRGLAIQVVADRAAAEREVGVSVEAHDWREVEPSREPGFDLVDPTALDVERMLAREDPQMIVDRLGHHASGVALARPPLDERQRHQEQRGHRGGRHEVAPPAPPHSRGLGGGGGPAGSQPALERQRRAVLGQPLLERLGQERFRALLVGARRALVQVRLERAARLRGEPVTLRVQQLVTGLVARHRA